MNLFCIVFVLDKIFTLKNEKTFSFSSLTQIFALPFNKVGCT